jgi:N-acyl amino acid synthase of PEP-CTERM/exosortase system
MNNDLIAAFNQFFDLVHANTSELLMQVYLLRYQVYVLETGFEADSDCHSGIDEHGNAILWEQDAFDERSDHYLLRHRRTGVYAATARLILPSPIDISAPFPIELHCPLDKPVMDADVRARLGEISRFAVSKVFKRRIGEMGSLAGVADNIDIYFEEDERRVLPHISLGLFAAVMRMVHQHQITHCYAVMEPALLRLLGHFGMVFNRIGPNVDYHGIRVPCITSAEETLPSIKLIAPSVWDLITNRGELMANTAA